MMNAVLITFIPGVRDIPRWIPIDRLIWRGQYRAVAREHPAPVYGPRPGMSERAESTTQREQAMATGSSGAAPAPPTTLPPRPANPLPTIAARPLAKRASGKLRIHSPRAILNVNILAASMRQYKGA
jgi:hypothetical protein